MRYTTKLSEIKGVGPKTALQLEIAGLKIVKDLIEFLPRDYEDYTRVTKIVDLKPGNVVLRGRITNVAGRYVRRGLHVTQAVLEDDSGKVPLTWFNQPYRATHLKGPHEWVVAGEFTFSQRRYQIMNPSVRSQDEVIESGTTVVPIYRQVAGIKSAQLRTLIEEIRPLVTMLPEVLPDKLVAHQHLLSYADAMVALHYPENSADIDAGKKRIAFQELVELLYAAELNKADNAGLESWQIPFDVAAAKEFVGKLPFALTSDQRRSAWDIIQNFEVGEPMNRLLQGDVGSGKTIVAGMAAYMAARAGFQSAIMAPTELLARQHAETLRQLLEPFNVTVGLLIGSIKKSAKEELKSQIAAGAVAVTVGTHALIQESVQFHRLGFVTIDEQHRFGVAQRQKILAKSDKMPHLLAMTATPIPRSLQLTVYGELEISLLREKPAGRKPILTKIHSPVSRAGLLKEVDKEIEKGRQVYVVCPLIEDAEPVATATKRVTKSVKTAASVSSPRGTHSTGGDSPVGHGESPARGVWLGEAPTVPLSKETDAAASEDESDRRESAELKSVTAEFNRLKKTAFAHRRIGLLHGKLSADDKQRVMQQFSDHELDVLVSTTVVEVGVDVPNATVMIIEGAERFGLAQLHQLRGRVGRSDHQSYCYLIPTEAKQTTSQRLKELERSNDGFYLAEKDLEMRGPGEIYGHMQHGQLSLQVANLADMRSIVEVKDAIAWARANDIDLLQYEGMRARVDKYRRLTTLN